MLKTPFLKAKLIVPDIPPGALYCDRIGDLAIAEARAVVITAPAGYGKTTAVLLSLQHCRGNIHWYRLDREDTALLVFFAHLIESLFGNTDEQTDSYRSLTSIGNINEEYSRLSAVVCQDAWSLYAHSDEVRYLVFDDFQNVEENSAICEIVRYLISNMPTNIRIIVISRRETGLKAEKMALSGDLVFLEGKNLLFTRDEIKLLFSEMEERVDSNRYAAEIFAYTEGWIAGVTLMKYMLKRRGTVDRKDTDQDRQDIYQYMMGEVFAGADRHMVLRAAVISLLDEFNGADLAGIFHFDDGEETIAWLERNNFYIYKINTSPASYRFHSLFRDSLRHLLNQEYEQNKITQWHLDAAAYFEKASRFQGAISHYLHGKDEKNAVRVAADRGISYMDNGDISSAAEMICNLPDHLVFSNATLMMIYGCVLTGTETERGFTYIEKAIGLAVKNKELNLAVRAQGFAISICVQQNNFHKIKDVIGLVPMLQAIRVSNQARKMLLHSLFLKLTTSFKVRPAKFLNRVIDRITKDDQKEMWHFSSLMSKAFLYGITGDFRDAERIIRELTGHPVALRNDRWGAFGLQLSCYLAIYMGEKDTLMQLAGKLTSLGMKYGDGFALSYGALFTSIAKYQARDSQGAIMTADKAEKLFIESRNLSMALFLDVQRLYMQAEHDNNGGFADRMEEKIAAFEGVGGNESLMAMAQAITAAQYIKEGVLDKGESLLLESWKWAKSKQALQTQCGIAMHLAALYHKKKDLRREEKYLRFFGTTAAKQGYVFFCEMRFVSLVRVCARCVKKNIAPQYMADLIGRYFGFEAATELLRDSSTIWLEPELFVQRYPTEQKHESKSVWIKLFGDFGLTIDGNEVGPEIFKTRKISGIFKYILANPEQTFSREDLATAFWPDSGGREAANSLNVALSELRRAVASLDIGFDSESALIAEDERGFYVCQPAAIESDVARFNSLHKQLRSGNLIGDGEKAALRELINLYDGDYLEESIADDSVVARLHYSTVFSEAARRLTEIYRSEGQTDLAEAVRQKHQKMMNTGLTQEEMRVALLLIEGNTRSAILRKLRLSAAEVAQYENAIRKKILNLGDVDGQITAVVTDYKLTKREAAMLRYLRNSTPTEEIAAELYISAETVRTHISRVLKKLGIKRRQDVAEWLESHKTG